MMLEIKYQEASEIPDSTKQILFVDLERDKINCGWLNCHTDVWQSPSIDVSTYFDTSAVKVLTTKDVYQTLTMSVKAEHLRYGIHTAYNSRHL